jgi:hypothetical protein
MEKLEEAIRLYNKFNLGSLWLKRRTAKEIDCTKDYIRFKKEVQEPLEVLTKALSPEDRKVLDTIANVIDMFDGKIVSIEDTVKK